MNEWPATKIEMRPIDSLIAYARNARVHSDKQVDKIVASIKEFGWTIPVLIAEDQTIIAGHGRILAAKKLGITEVPTMMAKGWSDAQRRAYVITDNQLTITGEWNEDLLKVELLDLKNSNFDLQLTGFDTSEIDELLKEAKESTAIDEEVEPSKADELQSKWNVQEGEIWICGDHRILCSDCTNQENIKRLLQNEMIHLLLTDPPYGVKMDKGFSGAGGFAGKGKPIPRKTYSDTWDSDRPSKETFKFIVSLAANSIIWGGNFFADLLPMSQHWLVWDKHQTMPTFGDCELAWTNIDRKSVKKYDVEYNGLIGKEKERFHPTQKPIKLFAQVIDDYTDVGDKILDVYAGSGTSLIAAEETGRIARLVERSPAYCSVSLERWSQMMNQEPRRE